MDCKEAHYALDASIAVEMLCVFQYLAMSEAIVMGFETVSVGCRRCSLSLSLFLEKDELFYIDGAAKLKCSGRSL